MKILYYTQMELPSQAANTIQVVRMCEAWAENGHEVYLLFPKFNENKIQHNKFDDIFEFYGVETYFNIVSIPRYDHVASKLIWARDASQYAALLRPDLVIARWPALGLFSAQYGLSVIFEEHQIPWIKRKGIDYLRMQIKDGLRPPYKLATWGKNKINNIVNKEINYVLPLQEMAGLFLSGGFFSEEKMLHMLSKHPNLIGVLAITEPVKSDLIKAAPKLNQKPIKISPSGSKLSRQLYLDTKLKDHNKIINIGYCGNLYPGKGMEIIADLTQLCPWAYFHIIGGRDNDPDYWRNKIKSDNIHFYGHVSPNETEAYIAQFDIGLIPNQASVKTAKPGQDIGAYTSPIKAFEYMAAGCPIIASDLPVLREVLVHGYNAYLCPHDDAYKWAQAIEELVQDPEQRNSLGQQGLADLKDKYTWTARAGNIEKWFAPKENRMKIDGIESAE